MSFISSSFIHSSNYNKPGRGKRRNDLITPRVRNQGRSLGPLAIEGCDGAKTGVSQFNSVLEFSRILLIIIAEGNRPSSVSSE